MHLVQAVGVTTWEWMSTHFIPGVDESLLVQNVGHHVWESGSMGGECIFEKIVQFLRGIGYDSAQQLTISAPFAGWLFFWRSATVYVFQSDHFSVSCEIYHFVFELFLSELWVMSTHNDAHFDSKSWRFCCTGTRKKGLDESKSLACN